ncbi:MAG TPA: small ribosomal subunit Rsm22 family protein [Terriglobales bacterium]|nr:small ribosomal subunit Rsm22 family protein [Terriglobales bacterium]
MRLPDRLREAIEQETLRTENAALVRASAQLTERYKDGQFCQSPLNTTAARHAYLHVRVPATYAANRRVLSEIQQHSSGTAYRSMLDLGSGPGTAMWAAADVFPSIDRFTLLERDGDLIEIGRRLAFTGENLAVHQAQWLRQDLSSDLSVERHDLVVISYALSELNESAAASLVRRAWMLTNNVLAIVEPGTPRNFERVLAVRAMLIEAGAHLIAPCPHTRSCPMGAAGDWCHFSQRLERTSAHRRIKGGALGYEDEKFSYIAASKFPTEVPAARIVRHPGIHSRHVQLDLCTTEGLKTVTVGKARKDEYRTARRSEWGDVWEPCR